MIMKTDTHGIWLSDVTIATTGPEGAEGEVPRKECHGFISRAQLPLLCSMSASLCPSVPFSIWLLSFHECLILWPELG